jgi:signal transduction histidine kinase
VAILATVRGLVPTLFRNRRLVTLFVLMVLLPAFVFSLLIVRAIGNEQLRLAYETIERQKQVVASAEADLNAWLFSNGPQSARSQALLRFETSGGQILFPDFDLSLPAVGAPRLRPFDAAPPAAQLDAAAVTVHYYPRVQVFLRDVTAGRHAGAQYFLRLRSLVVRPPGASQGYVVPVEPVVEHVNRKLAELSARQPFTARVWVAEAEKGTASAADAYGFDSFPFFEVVFTANGPATMLNVRRNAFAYSMTLLVAITVLGSVVVHRAVSQEIRLSQLRKDFVAAVSHEFRSPLSSIAMLAERLVSERTLTPEQLAEYHRIIDHDARRLSGLVSRLLEFAQIEEGKAAYALAPVDLVAVTQEAIEPVRHLAGPGRVRFNPGATGPLWILGDRVALSHAVKNLIENAAKYSPADTPIDVVCASANGRHVVEVMDRGIGIPAAEHEKIFEKFYRGQNVAALNVQGVGIGLALVKHVMDSHGGSVSVESRAGDGSRFCLRFPPVEA